MSIARLPPAAAPSPALPQRGREREAVAANVDREAAKAKASRSSGFLLPLPLWGRVGEGGATAAVGVKSAAGGTHRLNSCRSTSFIAWLSCGCSSPGSLCAGGDGAAGAGELGGVRLRLLLPPWPNPCCSRLPKVSPSLPSWPDCPLSPEPVPPDPPSPPNALLKPPPCANRPLPISLSLA